MQGASAISAASAASVDFRILVACDRASLAVLAPGCGFRPTNFAGHRSCPHIAACRNRPDLLVNAPRRRHIKCHPGTEGLDAKQ